ncbi:hypothetical protein B566_EDAN003881 [Ephemera danica]|nr:hypothetical protein B566_EDAN003881 [Ephemera danica]
MICVGTSVMSLESRTESRIIGSGMFSGMRGHAASSTPFTHFGSRLALGQSLTRSAPMEPQAGPSGLQSSNPTSNRFMPPPSFMKEATEVNGDDLSDSSESTSGCSSLVPQGGRHDSEQPRSSNIKTLQTTHNSSGRGLEQRSRYTACDRESSLPQAAASNKRPCFDVSILGPNTRTGAVGEKLDLTKSPFYTGKTCYGGASAYRKLTITPSLNKSVDSLVNHTLPKTSRGLHMSMSELPGPRKIQMAPSTPRPSSRNASVGEASTASTLARRILDAMESCSTPVSDCSQIPLNDSGLLQKRKRPAEEDLYEYRTPPAPRAQGPPSVPLQVPGVQELLKMKREQAKIQDSIEAARKRLQSQKKPWQEAQLAYSFRNDTKESSQYSNKMKGRQRDDDLEEMPQQVNLPQVALPITNLPKIDLGPSTFAKSSSSVGGLDLPVLPEGATKFTFSTPIVVKTPNKNNATPSRPLSDASSPLKFSWPSQSNGSNVSNIPKDLAKPSSVNLDSKHKTQTSSSSKKVTSSETPKVTNSLGDMFKPAPGSWSCQVCDVRNKSESKSCVACTSPKPGLKPDPPKPSVSQTPLSSFGAKFSNTGKWECSGCMLYNDHSLDKCPSCTTAKPGSSVKPVSSFGAKFSNTGKWECSSCMVYNDNNLDKCVSCTTPKAGATPVATPSLSGFGDKFKKPSGSWECPVCLVLNKEPDKKCVSCSSHKPGESSPPKASLTFSFGAVSAKTSSTDAPTFKFGVEPDSSPKVNAEVKFSNPSSTFTFGVQATTSSSTGSTTPTPSSTSVATPTPGFTFGVASKVTDIPVEQKTFPAMPFASPTSGSLKRSAEPEPKGFQFGTPISEKLNESPKVSFPISEKPKASPKISFPDVSDNSSPRRDNSEEPSSKKQSFGFGGSNVTEEVAKLPVPAFSFGSKSAATSGDDKQQSNFMFQQSSSSPKPKVAPAVTSAPASALFSFGAPASTTPSGTGFSIPSFGAAKPAESIAKPAESVAKPAESIAKPAVSTPSFGTTKLADAPSMFGAVKPADTTPMFGAKSSSSSPMFGGAEKPTEKSMPAFGAISKPTETTESPKPFSFGASAFGSNNTPAFGLPTATTTASSSTGFGVTSTPSFGSNTGTTPAMFGSASPKPAAPMFGSPVTSVASSAASNIPLFGAPTTTSTVSIFGAKPTTTAASFGLATSAPLFGSASTNNPMFGVATTTSSTAPTAPFGSTKTVTFGEKSISGTTNNTSPFTFGANAQASSNNSGAPPPYPFAGGSQNTPAPVGGFAFGSNTGAPATSNVGGFSFNSATSETKPFQFGATTPAFPAVKPPESTPMFGAPTTPMFAATPASNSTPTFGATTPQFVENNSTSTFQTPNFGFGSTPTNAATFGFSAGQQNTNTAPTPAGGFMFGQQQPSNPPQFNPNIKPTFNFTQGAAPTMFQATTTQQSTGPVPQRKIKRATRRMTPR